MGQDLTNLRPALKGGGAQLSRPAKAEIHQLLGAHPARFLGELLLTWGIIGIAAAVGLMSHNIWVTLACIWVIGTRQMVLGLLMHEQVHRLGLRTKYGDWIVNFFAVFPLGVTTVEDYAKVHLSHHKYFMTSRDPDFIRKAGPDWTFPAKLWSMVRIVLGDLTGLNTIKLIKGKTAPKNCEEFERRNPTPKWLRISFFVALIAILTIVHGWVPFLIYWVIPLLTVLQLIVRWTAVFEHKYNVENADVHEVTPLILVKWWQRVLIPDLNFSMHIYHHLHTGISFSKLPRVHAIYAREGLVDESAVFHGYGAYIAAMLRR